MTRFDHSDDSLRLVEVASYGILGDRRTDLTRWYDDGFGPVWIYRDAGGLIGIVRARTWEDAYGICEDVIFDDANPADLVGLGPDDDLPEGIGYRPNGADTARPWAQTGLYQTDLNGEYLEPLSARLMDELRIGLVWESYDND